MPTYEYECQKCHAVTERVRSFKERHFNATCMCGAVAKYRFSGCQFTAPRYPYVHHFLDKEPILIKNRRQEKDEFTKRGLNNVGKLRADPVRKRPRYLQAGKGRV